MGWTRTAVELSQLDMQILVWKMQQIFPWSKFLDIIAFLMFKNPDKVAKNSYE